MNNSMKNKMNQNKQTNEQTLITEKLKIFYNSVQEEAIPDRFLEMLEQLEQAEQAEKQAKQQNIEQETEQNSQNSSDNTSRSDDHSNKETNGER